MTERLRQQTDETPVSNSENRIITYNQKNV